MKKVDFSVTVERIDDKVDIKMLIDGKVRVALHHSLKNAYEIEGLGTVILAHIEHAIVKELGNRSE